MLLWRWSQNFFDCDSWVLDSCAGTSIVTVMVTESDMSQGRSLLGLRPPADLAESAVGARAPSVVVAQPAAQPEPQGATPARPSYPTISSGWDAEDEEARGKGNDFVTALKAGAVLTVFIIAIALLLR